jgi:DNA-binding GntR family transcriptional regulator
LKGAAYKTVADTLRKQIEDGAFPPDRRLPTDAELSAAFGVSRQTVRQAFGELVAEGLVYRVPGRGSFAVGSPGGEKYLRSLGSVDDLLALAVDTEMEVVEPLARVVDVAAASRLRLSTDQVGMVVSRRLHRGEPFSLTTTYIPPDLADRIAADPRIAEKGATSSSTVIALLDWSGESPLAGAHQSIGAALADEATAELIDCAPGDPVLTIDRIYFDRRGRFVELAISTFNVRRYSYRLELRRSIR